MVLKKRSIFFIGLAAVIILIIAFWGETKIIGSKLYSVKKTKFEFVIDSKGEIQGKNTVLIKLHNDFKNRSLRIRELQIKDLIQEGTLVKKGDWVATLDIASINRQIEENKDDMEEDLAEFDDAKIDSTIELTNYREEIKEFKFDLEYKTLELEQAKYESVAYQRKAKVAYNKTIREMDAKLRNYERKRMYLAVSVKRDERDYNYRLKRDSLLKEAIINATVTAPQDGMVMYTKVRGGRKIRVGDNISQWSPTIATLPDMSVAISETYVEEIDITKIAIGNIVNVTVDALPESKFTGIVTEIANIGQELTSFESMVFQVIIELDQSNLELKPGMTTSNNIIIDNMSNVLTVPRQCIYSENGINFVYIKTNRIIWKKKVVLGLENEKEYVIESGLAENDKIYFNAPENTEEILFIEN
ncbi:MAG: HlyD family efflux transporter periplasmic adaptor subunit [Draconibacterium sp.]|nr:HlyD family efflux transporter periplasmic adaptor subunit [Draconibacterium sp.]